MNTVNNGRKNKALKPFDIYVMGNEGEVLEYIVELLADAKNLDYKHDRFLFKILLII